MSSRHRASYTKRGKNILVEKLSDNSNNSSSNEEEKNPKSIKKKIRSRRKKADFEEKEQENKVRYFPNQSIYYPELFLENLEIINRFKCGLCEHICENPRFQTCGCDQIYCEKCLNIFYDIYHHQCPKCQNETKELMSIKEFIDSDGSLNINTHPSSQKLEEEFQKNNLYKENINFADFDIIALIGQGNTSNIYLATYQDDYVALKVIDKAYIFENDMIDNIILEKNILSSFTEENYLCHMKFFFMTNTKICFVLPFYPGGDLYSFLESKGPFDDSITAFYGVQVAHMLSFLHSKNIVYRDLKLENLMLDEKTELQSSFDGSIDYMAPEVISGEGHGMMADWWSYGVLMYELLCGKPPFHEGSTDRILDLITTSNVRFSSKIKASSVTRDFINKLLKKSPKERIGQNEFNQITTHHFFQSTNVNAIVNQKLTPPLMPNVSGQPYDNFEAIFTNQEIENFEESTNPDVIDQINELFNEFKN